MPEEQLPEKEQEEDPIPAPIDIRDAQKDIRAKKTKAIAAFAYWIAIGDRAIRKELGLPETEQEFADKNDISRRQLQRIKKLKSFQYSVDQVQKKLWAVNAQEWDFKIRKAFLEALVAKPNKGMLDQYFMIRGWFTPDGREAGQSPPEKERDLTRDELIAEVTDLIAEDPNIAFNASDDEDDTRSE